MSFEKQKKNDDSGTEISRDVQRVGAALAGSETVMRYGSANAEFIKGYSGVDNETGKKLAKGLKQISQHKVNADPKEAIKNIKQQAGYSAEVASTSRDNAKAIIEGSATRTIRSDDLAEYGRNHNVVDRVQVLNGEIIEGSQTQMKFVGDRNKLFNDITKVDGKFARYRGVKLELPSEQFEGAKDFCLNKAKELREQAVEVTKAGNVDAAKRLEIQAENYEKLSENVRDSGITTEQAIAYRTNPGLSTFKDIARTSHGAGIETMKFGTVIGGSISILRNSIGIVQGEKELGDAALSVVKDTTKVAAFSYGTGFVGSAIKGSLQQSTNGTLRAIALTNAPALAVNVCISLTSSVKRYVTGDLSEAEFLAEVGEKGFGMLSAGMMGALGQIAIPIPIVGAAVGGMIGYMMSSLFYQSALDASRSVEISAQKLKRAREIQKTARKYLEFEKVRFDKFITLELPELRKSTKELNKILTSNVTDSDVKAMAINNYAELLGQKLQFRNMNEFEDFMANSDAFEF